MHLIVLAVVGVVFGAVGSELFRAYHPEAVAKVEDAAKRLVDSFDGSANKK